ncbi:MAG TPA: 2'-5' RNA ligase family protein, partial [Thermoleophilaceae bacterium]|nr:2'-5' RNA ligase family protein [Thermoleophilaceae bacterium]
MARWRDSTVDGRDELRPVADEALHVTLVFLGRREAAVAQTVWEAVAGATSGLAAPRFVARKGAWVPPRRARLLAVDLEDRQARGAAVQRAVSDALV